MPHFHFHLDECGITTPDADGSDHEDLDAARRAATVAAREIMCEELKDGRLCLSCFIDIADPSGRSLARLDFADVVKISGLR